MMIAMYLGALAVSIYGYLLDAIGYVWYFVFVMSLHLLALIISAVLVKDVNVDGKEQATEHATLHSFKKSFQEET